MSYQGWKNYETWCINLWLDNDEGLYNTYREQAKDIVSQHTSEDDDGNQVWTEDDSKEKGQQRRGLMA